MRARNPDVEGFVERDGVKVGYQVYGGGRQTVLLMPTWSIVDSRHWKLQVPYLSRRARVVTIDGRGNGRSDRPAETAAYASAEFVADALAVLDEVGVDRAVVAGVSMGGGYAVELAATAPERVSALIVIGGTLPFMAAPDSWDPLEYTAARFHQRIDAAHGWETYNEHEWRERYPDFVRFFFGEIFVEPHSTKPLEDTIDWARDTTGETLAIAEDSRFVATDHDGVLQLLSRVQCPALVIHGDEDRIVPVANAQNLAELLGAELLVLEGAGHLPQVREPVVVNRAIASMLDRVAGPASYRIDEDGETAMRARYPDVEDFIERDGVKVGYEFFDGGDPAIVFPPVDGLVDSRAWKAQVPYLARRHKVVTIDPRGNGRSDKPATLEAYSDAEYVADTLAVMDAVGIPAAVLVGSCTSGWRALLLAAEHPERVLGVISIATWAPFLTPPVPARADLDFEVERSSYEGWEKANRHYWLQDWRGYAQFFFGELLSEPHSTKQFEDCVEWAMGIGPEAMMLHDAAPVASASYEDTAAILRRVQCPVLAIHGTGDQCQPAMRSDRLARLTGGQYLALEGAGHLPQAREPIVVNHAIRDFIAAIAPPAAPVRRWTHPLSRQRRVLFLSSPIGLGHSRRDIAIADELRRLRPDIEVDWLAQHPLTELLERRGEHIHPASAFLASESAHIESESAEHDLHAFQTIRRMDEILVNNFMVFSDLVEDQPYDAWIGDESWELDYFLHENPELKRAPFVWLTDFVGWLPMPDGGEHEAMLTADYNAEMVEQIARLPRLRDRSLFVGNPDDIVPDALGPALPGIREWTEQHFDFVGYVTGFDPAEVADSAAIRAELGYREDEKVCIVTVGGSGVGKDLLRRAIAAYPQAKRHTPELRMIVVAGPRIDPGSLPSHPGLEIHAYVHDLYRHLAVCDLAVVQGGLTTTMELTANQRPFLYIPLRHHFEQNFHVRHRLNRYNAGRCVDYDQTTPDELAAAISAEIGRTPDYLPVETGGATRAAIKIAELV